MTDSPSFETIAWRDGAVVMLDQLRLPQEEVYERFESPEAVADAIRRMVIRGAPAIGIAAAMGMALATRTSRAHESSALLAALDAAGALMATTRPTAVNLFWAIERMRAVGATNATLPPEAFRARMQEEAQAILEEDIAANRAMGRLGAELLPEEGTVLTHCNAGALATGGWGTALGVIRSAIADGKKLRVFADETRPYLQGARLTAWELQRDGIDVTLLTDSTAGWLMHLGEIDAVIVGADRIIANGDVANKIGTYSLSVLCRDNGVPFYVAAPTSTIDMSLQNGEDIEIEQRSQEEVLVIGGKRIAPVGVPALHPAFDVTPNRYVTAIITERGVARPPYRETLRELA